MAFPALASRTVTSFATSVTSMAVNMPATVNSGDLLIALVEVRNPGTWTKPTGWNDISTISQLGGASVGKLNGFYKIAAGTEGGGTATWIASVGTSAVWQVLRITGWHGTTPPEATTASGDATNANPPTLSPSWGSDDNLFVAVAGNSATGETTGFTAAPTNYGSLQSNGASSGGATVNIATATRNLAASSDDPGTFTPNSNRFWAAATIAVRPAGAAGVTLTVQDAAHAHSADSPALTQKHTLAVADALNAHAAESPTLTQKHTIVVQEAAHSHAADSPTLIQDHHLSVDDAAHAHTADNILLTQKHTISVQDASHAHSSENIDLTQKHVLVVADALHAHSADSPTLSSSQTLIVQDAVMGHAADNITLSQKHTLVIQDALHGHSVDAITLVQDHLISVQNALHGHSAENPTLSQGHVLTMQGASHEHTSTAIVLTQKHLLLVESAVSAHLADNITIILSQVLTVYRLRLQRGVESANLTGPDGQGGLFARN